ncbi:hypothetical protein OG552_31315 [Streptomyces sp. NBC_01476]|uniref:hypothetical protein n=1 Tax=Streptomyces sp. NBC_01476 TaxID=2903881 RepID=UPI002E36F2F1|nr:hypothetical protein [Streptomyces sp. NBC_01476]
MSDAEHTGSRHHGHVQDVVERVGELHDRAVRQREEKEPAEAVGYDVDADLGGSNCARSSAHSRRARAGSRRGRLPKGPREVKGPPEVGDRAQDLRGPG